MSGGPSGKQGDTPKSVELRFGELIVGFKKEMGDSSSWKNLLLSRPWFPAIVKAQGLGPLGIVKKPLRQSQKESQQVGREQVLAAQP